MKIKFLKYSLISILVLASCSLNQNFRQPNSPPLQNWNNYGVKGDLIEFVISASSPADSNFVPQSKRIAVFDLDGTLLCERPMYANALVAIDHLKKQMLKDHNLAKLQPYKAIAEKNMKYLWRHPDELLAIDFAGKSQAEYTNSVQVFFETQSNPDNEIPYKNLFYLPMVELIKYLQERNFQIYIVSGSSQGFIRGICEKYLGIPKDQIIGSEIKLSVQKADSTINFIRNREFECVNNDTLKALNIYKRIGQKPILAFGNSDGDLQMLELAQSNSYSNMQFVINHDDPEREYEYYKDELLRMCEQNGWKIVSMKNDFRVIFESEKDE